MGSRNRNGIDGLYSYDLAASGYCECQVLGYTRYNSLATVWYGLTRPCFQGRQSLRDGLLINTVF